ncbi:MAG: guanylate kinase [Oscillospiraceae bacterium]|nr:guanylate kinase [Oscillospiraceae bacterium]
MERGKTFIISGPSGVGKSTILHKLFERRPNLYFSVSATTRGPREGEVDGKHYHFTSAEDFKRMIGEDAFLEHAEFVGNYYGTPKRYVYEAMERGEDVILDIELQGAIQVHEKMPEAIRVFILPPSLEELERRLVSRGTETAEKIQGRLTRAKVEFESAHTYDYIVINDDVEHAVSELDAIMTAEHCRAADRAVKF